MAKKQTEPTRMDKRLQLVLNEKHIQIIDNWRRKQPDIPGRSEAVRRILEWVDGQK